MRSTTNKKERKWTDKESKNILMYNGVAKNVTAKEGVALMIKKDNQIEEF